MYNVLACSLCLKGVFVNHACFYTLAMILIIICSYNHVLYTLLLYVILSHTILLQSYSYVHLDHDVKYCLYHDCLFPVLYIKLYVCNTMS